MNCTAKDGSPLVNMCDTHKLLHAASLKTKNHTLYDVVSIESEMKAVAIVRCQACDPEDFEEHDATWRCLDCKDTTHMCDMKKEWHNKSKKFHTHTLEHLQLPQEPEPKRT